MLIEHALALTLAYVLDLLIGDPPHWPHPVRWIGNGIACLEKHLNKGRVRKLKGTMMVITIIAIVFVATSLIIWACRSIHPFLGIVAEGIIIFTTIARRNLQEHALDVYGPLREGNLPEARRMLARIVGRDTEQLDEGEIVRGTVETVAENTSDGVTAPLFWGFIGGAPLAMVYRAINTCDSMVGYKNERYSEFGWASARLDDVINWIPSRLTGFLILLMNKPKKISRKRAWQILFRDAKRHPSPNSGWLEASVAAILGVQLGGINYYKGQISKRAKMGEPLVPLQKQHIPLTNGIMTRTSVMFLMILWIGGIAIEMALTRF